MDEMKSLKILRAVAGAGVARAAGLIDQKSQEKTIEEKVKEALNK